MQTQSKGWALTMLKRSSLANINYFALALVMSIAFVLSGCAVKNVKVSDSDNFVFTDALGRTVSIPRNPQRVASLIGGFADVWMLSGGEVCAAPSDAWEDFELPLGDAVNLGGAHSPNTEALLSSNPDFVIASAATASNVALENMLENAGIPVAYFDVDCFEDYLSMLDICTDITGRKDLYEQNGTILKQKIESVKLNFKQANLSQKQRTVLLLRVSSGSVKTKGSTGTVLGEMLDDLGCVNIADSDTTLMDTLNIESILHQDPYHIFVVFMGDDSQKAKNNLSKMIEENPAWRTLSAVKENRLHFMDRKLFHIKPNEKWAESYEQLSRVLLETN